MLIWKKKTVFLLCRENVSRFSIINRDTIIVVKRINNNYNNFHARFHWAIYYLKRRNANYKKYNRIFKKCINRHYHLVFSENLEILTILILITICIFLILFNFLILNHVKFDFNVFIINADLRVRVYINNFIFRKSRLLIAIKLRKKI